MTETRHIAPVASARIWPAAGMVLTITAVCWVWIASMSRDMYGAMAGPAAWMMTNIWDQTHLLLLGAMWVAMMMGMMLPSLLPAIVGRKSRAGGTSSAKPEFVLGYMTVWIAGATSLAVLHRLLAGWGVVSPMMEIENARIAGAMLIFAGLYQVTPWKSACLGNCRMAAGEPNHGATWAGGYRTGVASGLGCVGCCGALMLVLFAGGVMKLWLNLTLTGVILAEKVLGSAWRGVRLTGVVLMGAGLWELAR